MENGKWNDRRLPPPARPALFLVLLSSSFLSTFVPSFLFVFLPCCRYPWQTAGTGNECDLVEFANKLEVHVGGGIALLLEKFLLLGGNDVCAALRCSPAVRCACTTSRPWLTAAQVAELAAGIADFYASLTTTTTRAGELSIKRVVPPDEFATGFPTYSGVDDSVYVVCALSLIHI